MYRRSYGRSALHYPEMDAAGWFNVLSRANGSGFRFCVSSVRRTCARAVRRTQLFSYSNIGTVNTVSGVISPTNLSLLSNPGGGSPTSGANNRPNRGSGGTQMLPRWNTPFITLDEEYNMMTPLIGAGHNNAGNLIDDGKRDWFFPTSDRLPLRTTIGPGGGNGPHYRRPVRLTERTIGFFVHSPKTKCSLRELTGTTPAENDEFITVRTKRRTTFACSYTETSGRP